MPHKEIFTHTSPRSPLSVHSPDNESLDLAMDAGVDTSIDQLYHNVCEMQSSDHSPSRYSFLSYGQESRIDSELRFHAGGDFTRVDPTKEGVVMQREKRQMVPLPKNKTRVRMRRLETKDGAYLGPYLLKQTRKLVSYGENPKKALELAVRAMRSFESACDEKPNLEYVMCLHIVAALYCNLGQYREAIPLLERSIEIPVMDEGQNHSLAKFVGCMQLGDTYARLGQIENSILCYTAGLEIQRQVLGEKDSRPEIGRGEESRVCYELGMNWVY